jgi:hypothetical protein
MAITPVTHHPMRIDGEAVDADERYKIVNPATILPGRET